MEFIAPEADIAVAGIGEKVLSEIARVERLFDRAGQAFVLPNTRFPMSVSRGEGAVLHRLVIERGARNIFEFGTGLGYSTCWLGLAVAKTVGVVVSIDPWIDESIEGHIDARNRPVPGPLTRRYAHASIRLLGLTSIVALVDGWSPQDVRTCARPNTDFVFIDGFHEGEQPWRDFQAILPFLAEDAAILWHDSEKQAVAEALDKTGWPIEMLDTAYNLCLTRRSSRNT